MPLIKLENITKTYHVGEVDVPVLKGVSFSIERGELVALMGASGSGKSTLMNILGCLDHPTSGKYWLDGKEISGLAPNERALIRTAKLGFVFQSFNLLARTSALNNVQMPLDYSPTAPAAIDVQRRARDLLVRVGLADRLDHVPSQMSGGQQQRVAIARSLINEPALLLADEPTGNLDSKTSVEILEMFQQLNAAGLTVMIVTHDPKVASCCHRTIRVVDGLVVDDDASSVVMQHAGVSGAAIGEAATAGPPATNGPHFHAHGNGNGNGNGSNGAHANGHATGHGNGHANANGNGASGSSAASHGGVATATLAEAKAAAPAVRSTAPNNAANSAPAAAERALVELPPPSLFATVIPAPLRTALGALRRNKMRSGLTTLGIVIGVAAVIAMVEISDGSRSSLMKTMATFGANNIMIRSGAAASGGISFGAGSIMTLTPQDADAIAEDATAVSDVAPIVQIPGTQVIFGNRNWIPMSLQGTTPSFLRIREWENLTEGDMFTDADVRNSTRVCVVGQTLVKELFDGQSPIGKDVRVKNVMLRVIGVLSRKGADMRGMDQDDCLLAPWTTIKYRIADNAGGAGGAAGATNASGTNAGTTKPITEVNSLNKLYPAANALFPEQSAIQAANTPQPVRFTNVDVIMLKATSAADIPTAIEQVESILREKHRLRDNQVSDFNIRNMSEMLATMSSMSDMMGMLLLIVATISLAVGGVGIMNIMLVSVTERTREIGLRMAVGARSFHILRQFLIESIVLCLFGGLVGIAIGRSASTIVWYTLRWPIEPSLPAIVGAFLVSATIGIAFGFYPAWKASRLDPIEALRYE